MTASRTPDAPRLRVLMVTGAYFPEIGSAGLQCQTVARHLKDHVVIRVLTTAVDPALPREQTVDGVLVSRVVLDVTSAWSKIRATMWMVAALIRILPRIDVVHIHGYSQKNIPVTAIARLFRRRLVLSLHTAGFDEPGAVGRQ